MSSLLNPDAASADYISANSAEQTDLQLLTLVARGDEPAFSLLYARYSTGVYNYLLRLIREQPQAEELLQEVFVAVWQGAGSFKNRSSVKTWVYRIAHNQAVGRLRRIKRAAENVPELALALPEESVERQASVSLRADQVHVALDKLTPDHRAVVELVFVHSLSYAEVAEIVDCPIGTVKSRMSYALRYLSGFLKAQGFEEG